MPKFSILIIISHALFGNYKYNIIIILKSLVKLNSQKQVRRIVPFKVGKLRRALGGNQFGKRLTITLYTFIFIFVIYLAVFACTFQLLFCTQFNFDFCILSCCLCLYHPISICNVVYTVHDQMLHFSAA